MAIWLCQGPRSDSGPHLFAVVDDVKEGRGRKLSDEVFTSDGKWVNPRRTFSGTEELISSDVLLAGITGQSHVVEKVYCCNDETDDLLMMGRLEVNLEDGNVLKAGFCVRAVIDDDPASERLRLKLVQGWRNPFPQDNISLKEAFMAK